MEHAALPQAVAILTASLPDTTNSKGLLGKIQIFRNLRPYKGVDLPPTDPRYPVQRLVVGGMTNTLTEAVVAQCVSQHPFPSEADWKHNLPEIGSVAGKLWNLSRQTGLPQVVIQDMILDTMKIITAPSKEPGSRILVEFSGLRSQSFFIINEGGSYKIVESRDGLGEVGTEALYLHHGQEAEATSLLDWKRDLVGKGQGDDPLGGNLFARLWTTGESRGPQTIELAAASLLSGKSALLSLLPQVIAARKKVTTDTYLTDEPAEGIVLDLEEVTLVDLDVVHFLGEREAEGVELVNCSPYIRNSLFRERNSD